MLRISKELIKEIYTRVLTPDIRVPGFGAPKSV
jgi:hypothetical protein